MKKFMKVFCVFCTLSFALCTFSYAQEEGFIKKMWKRIIPKEKAEVKEKGAEEAPLEVMVEVESELTKEEMISEVEDVLDMYGDEIVSRIPNLVRKTDEERGVIYLFRKTSREEVEFEDLDEGTLFNLYRKATYEANIISQQDLMEEERRIREISVPQAPPQIPQPPRTIISPPQPPKIPTPPVIPSPRPSSPSQQRR